MPALLEDPTSPVVYRTSGQGPYPTSTNPQIPSSIFPRPVTLRDRVTVATLIPFFSPDAVPPRLLSYLCDNLNKEIEDGNTYPMINPMPLETFGPYWFGNFGAVMVMGDIGGIEAVNEMERTGTDWSKLCLGSFYVKPNYPGRSSHVCNGGFLVTPAARNKGVGKSMGQCYLDWAPQLGYTYSVFNLVYETNTASTRIWDSLGFKRIGRVPGCGNLKSFTEPVDAIIYGRDLKAEEGNVGNEERFDKIRYYLRHQLYPQGADRSEKSRLRSAATHYKLIPASDGVPEKLMLKDKEVISDPQQQYEIAKQIHNVTHGGINKTTAVIATQYHWVRIKETVSHVIKNCSECKDSNKAPILRSDGTRSARSKTLDSQAGPPDIQQMSVQQRTNSPDSLEDSHLAEHMPNGLAENMQPNHLGEDLNQTHIQQDDFKTNHLVSAHGFQQHVQPPLQMHNDNGLQDTDPTQIVSYDDMTLDHHMIEQIQAELASEYDPHQQHQSFGVPPSLSQYTDTSHLSHAPPTPHDFASTNPMDSHTHTHFLTTHSPGLLGHQPQPPSATPDHVMSDDDVAGGLRNGANSGGGVNNMQQMRHVLPMDYLNPNSQGPYKQQ